MNKPMSFPKPPKTRLDDSKLVWTAPTLKDGDRPPVMRYSLFGQPRITVSANSKSAKEAGCDYLVGAMDIENFYQYLRCLEELALHNEPTPRPLVIENFKDKKQNGPITKLLIGRDKDNMVYRMLVDTADKFPRIKFVFNMPYWHNYINFATGEPFTQSEMSTRMALSHVDMIRRIMAVVVVNSYVPPEPNGGNGGGGGYQRKPLNNSTTTADDFADEFDM